MIPPYVRLFLQKDGGSADHQKRNFWWDAKRTPTYAPLSGGIEKLHNSIYGSIDLPRQTTTSGQPIWRGDGAEFAGDDIYPVHDIRPEETSYKTLYLVAGFQFTNLDQTTQVHQFFHEGTSCAHDISFRERSDPNEYRLATGMRDQSNNLVGDNYVFPCSVGDRAVYVSRLHARPSITQIRLDYYFQSSEGGERIGRNDSSGDGNDLVYDRLKLGKAGFRAAEIKILEWGYFLRKEGPDLSNTHDVDMSRLVQAGRQMAWRWRV